MNNPVLPTVEDIMKISKMVEGFQTAWDASFISKEWCCEQGGWIYADTRTPLTTIEIERATSGDRFRQDKEGPKGTPNPAIDLRSPFTNKRNRILVATFHTHPLDTKFLGDYHPSKNDRGNGHARQVPGIIISRDGARKYASERRTNWESNPDPYGYPYPLLSYQEDPDISKLVTTWKPKAGRLQYPYTG
ncbi:hypothetical protein B0H19DRAFT_1371342 [Mycena capillaripes]|nr:hypothetical protein B0H19DRAFT_1386945 [Mycena capillaripes]KAJ6574126.1 hypothetical protein B0H19DRAFT_1371342 [Mycena capillaripes]